MIGRGKSRDFIGTNHWLTAKRGGHHNETFSKGNFRTRHLVLYNPERLVSLHVSVGRNILERSIFDFLPTE